MFIEVGCIYELETDPPFFQLYYEHSSWSEMFIEVGCIYEFESDPPFFQLY